MDIVYSPLWSIDLAADSRNHDTSSVCYYREGHLYTHGVYELTQILKVIEMMQKCGFQLFTCVCIIYVNVYVHVDEATLNWISINLWMDAGNPIKVVKYCLR